MYIEIFLYRQILLCPKSSHSVPRGFILSHFLIYCLPLSPELLEISLDSSGYYSYKPLPPPTQQFTTKKEIHPIFQRVSLFYICYLFEISQRIPSSTKKSYRILGKTPVKNPFSPDLRIHQSLILLASVLDRLLRNHVFDLH